MWVLVVAVAAAVCGVAQAGVGPSCESYGILCPAGRGLIQDSLLNLTEIVWLGPETQNVYVGSPSIVRSPKTGALIASHDFFGRSTLDNTVQVLINEDGSGGARPGGWKHQGNVTAMYWVTLFFYPDTAEGSLYAIGVDEADAAEFPRNIVIAKSDDEGKTWTEPSVLFNGTNGCDAAGTPCSYHCAPTPVMLFPKDGRLYRAFEARGNLGAMVISTKEAVTPSTNLLAASTWRASNPVNFSTSLLPPSWGHGFGWQEGNAVEGLDGNVYNVLRIDGQTQKVNNKAAICVLDPETNVLKFERMIDFPATSSKFTIRVHKPSNVYYTLSTNVTKQAIEADVVWARNNLVLAYSKDLIHWTVCSTLLTDDTGFQFIDSAHYTGFHYVDWVFDRANPTDILYSPRTGYRGSNSYHNANRLTFKRVVDFAAQCGL